MILGRDNVKEWAALVHFAEEVGEEKDGLDSLFNGAISDTKGETRLRYVELQIEALTHFPL